jgi:hypothetical protein
MSQLETVIPGWLLSARANSGVRARSVEGWQGFESKRRLRLGEQTGKLAQSPVLGSYRVNEPRFYGGISKTTPAPPAPPPCSAVQILVRVLYQRSIRPNRERSSSLFGVGASTIGSICDVSSLECRYDISYGLITPTTTFLLEIPSSPGVNSGSLLSDGIDL